MQAGDHRPDVAEVQHSPALEAVGRDPQAVALDVRQVLLDLRPVGGRVLRRGTAGQGGRADGPREGRPQGPAGRQPVTPAHRGQVAHRPAAAPRREDGVVEPAAARLHLPGAGTVVAHPPARAAAPVEEEAVAPGRDELRLRVVGGVHAVGEQVALEAAGQLRRARDPTQLRDRIRGAAPDQNREQRQPGQQRLRSSEVLLDDIGVELLAVLVRAPVGAAEAVEALAAPRRE